MASLSFNVDLTTYGPAGDFARAATLNEGRDYCRNLAERHYENFHVASLLLPRALRPHFHAVYAYCRWSDDLADEIHDPQRSLDLLDWWEGELQNCYAGIVRHPVFVALRETISEFAIPIGPFAELLVAFSPRPTSASLRDGRGRAGLLPLLGESGRPIGPLPGAGP